MLPVIVPDEDNSSPNFPGQTGRTNEVRNAKIIETKIPNTSFAGRRGKI